MIALLRGLPLLTQIAGAAITFAVLFGAYKAWEYKNYAEGRAAERAAIDETDRKILRGGEENASNRQDCVSAHGVDAWDVTRGVCLVR